MADEFEKRLGQMRASEDGVRLGKIEIERMSEEQKRLADEQYKKELPNLTFSAHVFFRNEIAPILRTVETAYLQGKTDPRVYFSVFTGSVEEWLAHGKDEASGPIPGEPPWPHCLLSWNDNGEPHDMLFDSSTTLLKVTAAGNRVCGPLIKFSNQDWKDELKKGIIELLRDPEKTHNTNTSHEMDDGH